MMFEVDIAVSESGRKSPQYTLESDLSGEVSLLDFLKFTKQSLILIADEVFREEKLKGFDKNPVVVVDGRAGKRVEDVSPLGQIELVARTSSLEILKETYEGLIHRSKILTGTYIDSHYVFLNGTQVATDMPSLLLWLASGPAIKDKDVIRFVNIQPYARRLELLGVTNQRQQNRMEKSRRKKGGRTITGGKIRAPNGTYFLTARAIRSKYKRNSNIRFTFITGASLGITGSFKSAGKYKRKKSASRTYLYPTIVITIQERGVT